MARAVLHKYHMNSIILYLVQFSFRLLPDTKCFGFKRFALRLAGANIGKNVRICSSVRIIGNSSLTIGNDTWIGHGTWIFCSAPIIIGDNVNIAPLCYVGTGTHRIDLESKSIAGVGVSLPIAIRDGAWICARAMILPGVTIGEKSVLAAGTVANKNVPAYVMVGGIPAKVVKEFTNQA